MDDSEVVKKIFKATSYSSNRRGRPRTTWKQNIEEDQRKLRASTNYETAAKDREGWRRLTKEALTHLGL